MWVSHSKTVDIIDIPGNHFTLLSQASLPAPPPPPPPVGLPPPPLPHVMAPHSIQLVFGAMRWHDSACKPLSISSHRSEHVVPLQEEEDMEIMLEALKVNLSPCGIGEQNSLPADGPSTTAASMHEADQAFSFLRFSGVPYFESLRTVQVSITPPLLVGGVG